MTQNRVQRAVAVVAEDEPILRLEAVDFLEEAGFEVLDAADAVQALRHLEQHPDVCLLFTDVQMPPGGMTGLDLAREVAERWPLTAIVICSGIAEPDPATLPSTARFVPKPFLPSRMRTILKGVADR
ncbi:response regulator [Methylobacterium soli]|uniref:Response regulator n=1 Tax=Methylobacterium soli TaxID=553447 RepID=A0A6L3T3D0_9HYPH|nr:response regulator [Methylobacterium soli]KAB1081180.1 response regulator [Methylobacterium soli]GJE45945.1 Blue-light-activated protein [Methylobacterium soli]